MSVRLARWSPLNPRVIVAASHALFAFGCLLRPNLDELLKAYQPFGSVQFWGWGLLLLAAVLLLARRASWLMMVAQLVSATALFTIAGLLSLGVGPLPTAFALGGLGITSLLLFSRAFGEWLDAQDWWHYLQLNPPRWITRQCWFRRLRDRHGGGDG